MPVEATPDTFAGLVEEGNVLVDFWGPRCQPCLAESYGDRLRLVKVNAPENRDVCRELKVLGLPTYLLFRDGAEVERLTGDPSKADIEAAVRKLVEGGE
jgi:thioredoxin 1